MIEEVKIAEKESFLEININGTDSSSLSPNDIKETWTKVVKACLEAQKFKVLVYWNLINRVSMNTGFKVSTEPVELFDWDKRIRIAVIHKDQSKNALELYALVEALAANRGYYFKNFARKEGALNWLQI